MIKFTCTDSQGQEVITEWRGPGRILGAVTVIAQRPALVTASALIACRIHCISAATFLQLMETDAEFMRSVLEVTSRQSYEQTFRYTQLAMASVRTRLAQVLLDLVPDAAQQGQGEIRLELPGYKTDLAKLLAIKPETLSRNITKLVGAGALRRRNDWLYVRNLERLRQEAKWS